MQVNYLRSLPFPFSSLIGFNVHRLVDGNDGGSDGNGSSGSDGSENTGGSGDSKNTSNKIDDKSFQLGVNKATAKWKAELEKVQVQLKEFEEMKQKIEDEKAAAELKELEKNKEYQKIIEKQKTSFEENQTKLVGKIGTLEDDIRKLVIDSEIIKVVPDLKVVPGSTSQIVQLVRPHFKFDKIENNGEVEYKVFPHKNGNQMINDKGKEMTVEEFLKDFIEQNPHFRESLSQGGSGSKSSRQTGETVIKTSRDAISLGLKNLKSKNQGA